MDNIQSVRVPIKWINGKYIDPKSDLVGWDSIKALLQELHINYIGSYKTKNYIIFTNWKPEKEKTYTLVNYRDGIKINIEN